MADGGLARMNDAGRGDEPAWSEADRQAALDRYRIVDTPGEAEFDDIARIAAQICGVPMALISLLDGDRQWFKARVGLDAPQTARDIAFCDHAIRQGGVFEVKDAARDDRFEANPLVTGELGLRFYAGAPIVTPEGLPLGTLCALDRRPHELDEAQRDALQALARQVMTQLELRRTLGQRRLEQERHRLIVESAVDYAIISMDLTGLVTSWNEGAHRILGWTEQEMCGRPCDGFFTSEDCAAGVPEHEMGRALATGRGTDERWHLRRDGSRFWASGEMMPLTDDDGQPVGFIKILRDRTEERVSRERLEASDTRTRLALEAAELGAWESTPALDDLAWDARTRELLDHDPEEALDYATSFISRIHPDDRADVVAANAAAAAPGGGRLDNEYRIVTRDGRQRWIHARGRLIEADGRPGRFVGTVRDISAAKAADEHRELLANELKHRVKNTLSVVQAIVSQSLRNVATPAEAREAIGDRLATLARAHDLLTQTSWTAAPMRAIIAGATAVVGPRAQRIHIDGPDLRLKPRSALALAMAVHELCTNATKYGALSQDGGHVEIGWTPAGDGAEATVRLEWREVGGPPVAPPTRKGFGSRLIESSLARDLGGEGVLDFSPAGLRWTLVARRREIEED